MPLLSWKIGSFLLQSPDFSQILTSLQVRSIFGSASKPRVKWVVCVLEFAYFVCSKINNDWSRWMSAFTSFTLINSTFRLTNARLKWVVLCVFSQLVIAIRDESKSRYTFHIFWESGGIDPCLPACITGASEPLACRTLSSSSQYACMLGRDRDAITILGAKPSFQLNNGAADVKLKIGSVSMLHS